jgi:membrane associated rhomboid family serine protease
LAQPPPGILGVVSEPDLFVVCKNCSSEVSPYVTECPYCGQRVRKRAPKLDRGEPIEAKPPKRQRTSLPRLRRGEIPGIATESRPYGTLALIVLSLLATVAFAANEVRVYDATVLWGPLDGDYWKLVSSPLQHDDRFGYAFIALTAVGIFGTMVERRFGTPFLITLFVLSGAAGMGLALLLEATPALGANGPALGLLCAWLVDDRLAARRGDDRENDLLGVYVFAAVLVLLSVAEPDASIAAAAGGAAVGTALGAIASPLRP